MNEQSNISNNPSNNTNMNNGFNMNPVVNNTNTINTNVNQNVNTGINTNVNQNINNGINTNVNNHTNTITHSAGFPVKRESTNIKKGNNKLLFILIPIIGVLVVVIGFLLYQLLFPKIYIDNFKDSYEINDFNSFKKTIKSTLFVKKDQTIWNINGYDFYKGEETTSIPIIPGENTLIITNGDLSKTYKFKINIDEDTSIVISDEKYRIPFDDLDFDGDGIPNKIEKEKGLSTYSKDTDGDGLLDNVELVMNLDPKKVDDYTNSRKFTVYQDDSEEYAGYLEVTGKGNIANTFLDTAELNAGFPSSFIQSDVLSVVTSNPEKPEKMTIYFEKSYSWNTDKYTIYKYDESDGKLEEIKTNSNDDYLYGDISLFNCLYFVGRKDKVPTGEYNNQIMILIDNSGSMFTKEYVAEKTNSELSNLNDDDYAHDVDFKRLSLMTSLVDRLGTDKYTYSVYAFTSSYCDIAVNSKDKKTVIDGINSLKTECQNFNGTDMSGAVRKYASKFDTDSYGKKYMIVLTDGQDTGWFTYKLWDSTLKGYAKQGINIITIGLSEFTDSEYLMNIASQTNGKYLYASDANMLDTLIEIIESSIDGQKTTEIDGEEVTLVADSGFKVDRDGFNFENFGSTTSPGGVCYGFSLVTKQIYLNKLPTSAKEVSEGYVAEKLIAYTLTENNKKRLVKGNVYNIKLNETYSTLLNVDASDPNYRYLDKDGIPRLNGKYKELTAGSGFEPYIKEINGSVELNIAGKIDNYSKYESLGNINLMDAEVSDKNKDDYQVLQLLNRGWAEQTHHIGEAIANKIAKSAQGEFYDYEKQVNAMKGEIESGAPAMLSITTTIGSHSVMATNVYRTADLEKYIIGIYDSNSPGAESKMYLERQVSYGRFSETSYYSLNFTSAGLTFYEMLYEG